MPVDMYLYVHGVRGDRPVVIDVLAWSGGAYGPGERGGYGSKNNPKKKSSKYSNQVGYAEVEEIGGDPAKWDVSQVSRWLEMIGYGDLSDTFERQSINGEALILLNDDDLKVLEVSALGKRKILGQRIHCAKQVHDEFKESEMAAVDHQTLSITAWMDASTMSGGYLPLVEGRVLPECVLVCYEGLRRPGRTSYHSSRGGGSSDDVKMPMGTPYWLQKMHDVTVASWSTGGSGGEDRFTLNMTLSFQSLSQSFLGIHARKSNTYEEMVNYMNFKQWEDRERFNEAWESKDPLAVAPGITVWVDTETQRYKVFEFGVHVRWSTASHRIWANEFKDIVRTTVMCHAKGTNEGLSRLPDYLLHHIFSLLSVHYNLDPFEEYPYPDQVALQEAIDAEKSDSTGGGGGGGSDDFY